MANVMIEMLDGFSLEFVLIFRHSLEHIVWLEGCKILSNITGMENFTIEHTNLGFFFFFKKN